MAERTPLPANVRAALTRDSFVNFEAGLGMGADNVNSRAQYLAGYLTRNRVALENIYRSSWIIGKMVNTIADDMTREGVDIQIASDENAPKGVYEAMTRLHILPRINSAIRWARLYGGSIAIMMIDGQDMATPLKLDSIRPDQFKGLYVLDRWMLNPSLDLVHDMGSSSFNKPDHYSILPGQQGVAFAGQTVHHTRVLRFEGPELPMYQKSQEMGWGMSVIEQLYDRLVAFDSTTAGTANLVHKAHLRIFKIKELRSMIAQGGKLRDALVENVQMIRRVQASEGFTLIDADDDMEAQSYTFSGLDNVLLQFGQQLSGATGIPLVKLFGQSPAGLSATGESDLVNYYDNISQTQTTMLREPLTRLFQVLYPSAMGGQPVPDDFVFAFNPLWQMSDDKKADIAVKDTQTILSAFSAALISEQQALREFQSIARRTGRWSSISNADVDAADDEPPAPGGLLGGAEGNEEADQENSEKKGAEAE